jgi:hypothetical protein
MRTKHIVAARLGPQRVALAGQLAELDARRDTLRTFGGKVHLLTKMFADSYAPSYTPEALFAPWLGLQLVAPYRNGYLVEATADRLPELVSFIRTADSVSAQVDISRVENVQLYSADQVLRGRSVASVWEAAPELERGKGFVVSFAPYRDFAAREQLLQTIAQLSEQAIMLPTYPSLRLVDGDGTGERVALPVISPEQTSLAIAMRRYRAHGRARSTIQVANTDSLAQLLASGSVFRIDPIPRLEVTTPGEG